jgi:hypothetical protein
LNRSRVVFNELPSVVGPEPAAFTDLAHLQQCQRCTEALFRDSGGLFGVERMGEVMTSMFS